MNIKTIINSLKYSGNLLIIEEGYSFAAWGSEVIARLAEESPNLLKKISRISMPEFPIPCCGPLEKEVLPNSNNVLVSIMELLNNE